MPALSRSSTGLRADYTVRAESRHAPGGYSPNSGADNRCRPFRNPHWRQANTATGRIAAMSAGPHLGPRASAQAAASRQTTASGAVEHISHPRRLVLSAAKPNNQRLPVGLPSSAQPTRLTPRPEVRLLWLSAATCLEVSAVPMLRCKLPPAGSPELSRFQSSTVTGSPTRITPALRGIRF